MRSVPKFHHLAVYFVWLPLALAQPLAKPLADFDKMVSVLKTNGVVAEPIRVGNTTIIPFASVQFGLGSAGAAVGFAGGLGAKTCSARSGDRRGRRRSGRIDAASGGEACSHDATTDRGDHRQEVVLHGEWHRISGMPRGLSRIWFQW